MNAYRASPPPPRKAPRTCWWRRLRAWVDGTLRRIKARRARQTAPKPAPSPRRPIRTKCPACGTAYEPLTVVHRTNEVVTFAGPSQATLCRKASCHGEKGSHLHQRCASCKAEWTCDPVEEGVPLL